MRLEERLCQVPPAPDASCSCCSSSIAATTTTTTRSGPKTVAAISSHNLLLLLCLVSLSLVASVSGVRFDEVKRKRVSQLRSVSFLHDFISVFLQETNSIHPLVSSPQKSSYQYDFDRGGGAGIKHHHSSNALWSFLKHRLAKKHRQHLQHQHHRRRHQHHQHRRRQDDLLPPSQQRVEKVFFQTGVSESELCK